MEVMGSMVGHNARRFKMILSKIFDRAGKGTETDAQERLQNSPCLVSLFDDVIQ
jgi:hypothetical protein